MDCHECFSKHPGKHTIICCDRYQKWVDIWDSLSRLCETGQLNKKEIRKLIERDNQTEAYHFILDYPEHPLNERDNFKIFLKACYGGFSDWIYKAVDKLRVDLVEILLQDDSTDVNELNNARFSYFCDSKITITQELIGVIEEKRRGYKDTETYMRSIEYEKAIQIMYKLIEHGADLDMDVPLNEYGSTSTILKLIPDYVRLDIESMISCR